MKYLLLFVLLVGSLSFGEEVSFDLLWRARALQAKEKIKNLKKNSCEYFSETAFLKENRYNGAFSAILEASGSPGKGYILNFSSKNKSFSTFAIVHNKKDGSTLSLLTNLGKGWDVLHHSQAMGTIFLNSPECNFSFNIKSPTSLTGTSK